MKKLEIKLDIVVKILAFGDFPNKQALLDGHGKLKTLFKSSFSQESLPKIIRELKANAFYRQFKLDADPQFLKALVKKVTDFKVIEELLKFSEINYSQQEKRAPVIPVSTCNSSIFKKFSALKKLSPIAKKALLNNLKKCNDSPHLKKFKR